MGVNLSGTTAWAVGDRLEPATYLMRPAPGGVSRDLINDKDKVKITWRVIAGPFTGAEQEDWVTVTEKAMGRVVQLIEACGQETPQEDFPNIAAVADWVAEMVRKGPVVEAVVRLEPGQKDPSKEWPVIAGYRKPNPSDVPSDAAGFSSGPKVANGAGSTGDDKPLPF